MSAQRQLASRWAPLEAVRRCQRTFLVVTTLPEEAPRPPEPSSLRLCLHQSGEEGRMGREEKGSTTVEGPSGWLFRVQ